MPPSGIAAGNGTPPGPGTSFCPYETDVNAGPLATGDERRRRCSTGVERERRVVQPQALRSGTATPTKRAPLHETVSGPRIVISFAEPKVWT